MSNIFIWVKKDFFGYFRIEEIRDKYNATGLQEGGGIEMSTTVLPFTITIITILLQWHNKHSQTWKKIIIFDNYNLVCSDTIEMSTTVLSIHYNDNYNLL